MRKVLAIGLAASFLVAAGTSSAAPEGVIRSTHNSFTCTWTATDGGSASCQRVGKVGLVTVVSQSRVVVRSRKGRVLARLGQPAGRVAPLQLTAKTATETHNKVTCTWAADNDGTVVCSKASKRGLLAANTGQGVAVANPANKVIFQGS